MTMNCDTAVAMLNAYADGEIDALQNYSIARHLLDCANCAAMGHRILALRARIRTELIYFSAPSALRARVTATVEALCSSVPPRMSPKRDCWRWLIGGALAGCMASVFAWTVGSAILTWRVNEDFAVAAVAAHVRATLGNRLVEVASSNQHTVKPWLSAHLDYSPPVQDLADEGFALRRQARLPGAASHCYAGLHLRRAHDRRLRPAAHAARGGLDAAQCARLQRCAREWSEHGLACSVGCRARSPVGVCATACARKCFAIGALRQIARAVDARRAPVPREAGTAKAMREQDAHEKETELIVRCGIWHGPVCPSSRYDTSSRQIQSLAGTAPGRDSSFTPGDRGRLCDD